MSIFFKKQPETQGAIPAFYDDYKEIRDESWRILAENGIKELPIDLVCICDAENIDVYSYSQAEVLIASLHLQKQCKAGGCLTLMPDGRRIILYDDCVPIEMRRFLIACGIGYFVLGYAKQEKCNENTVVLFSSEEELQAGIFAGRLLAPLSVLWAMGVQNADEIRRVCLIPKATAEKRFSRLGEMDLRNLESGAKSGVGTMFLSGYERCAFRNFSGFAEEYRQKIKK
ncbi:MAG: hypothetical protein E7523_01190 [Ruminococcaceae bacterium]|nr:hypothetical protein [Oscillospiraceae bacterium]